MKPIQFSIALFFVFVGITVCNGQTQKPPHQAIHKRAHAHNDYEHARPLLDAVDNGFCSVEADIYLVDGKLAVAHHWLLIRRQRTLTKLYLDPLRKIVKENGGSVHGDNTPLILLIDIKREGEATYKVLAQLLSQYPDLFGTHANGERKPGPVRAIISGARPVNTIRKDTTRLVGIDGRPSDFGSNMSVDLLPLISDHWGSHFRWRGVGDFPANEKNKLRQMVQQAHSKGRLIRFWASPDNRACWAEQKKAGVDLINTNRLEGLNQFLSADE